MKTFDLKSIMFALISAISSPTFGLAADSDLLRFFLVRSPEILEGTPCSRSDATLGVILFSPEVNTAKYTPGGRFTVISPNGDIRTAKLEILPNASECHVLAGAAGYTFELLRFDRPVQWAGHDGDEALLAYSGGPDNGIKTGKMSKQEAPDSVRKEVNRLAGIKEARGGKVSAQVFSFSNSPKKFGVLSTSVFPKDYAQVGDKGIIYFSTFWEIVGESWKRTAKVDGTIRVFSVVNVGGSVGSALAVNESGVLAGTYKVIEFKNGKPEDTVQTLYKWMD